MKFHFLWVGKTKNKNWLALQDEYLKRLGRFCKFSITELKDKASHETVEAEGNRILEKVNPSSFVCLLDVGGKSITSHEFASQIEDWQIKGIKELTFVIGGFEGVSSAVEERADYALSLSFLTMTHEMARVVLIEQIYRAFTILKGHPYQK
ncbi:MAG: 23S rRNA (pseudouridine(1915)-N(3))-methyltransferase RlmH [Pyrinomonadaceae bacterium]